jgi:hypothetical protein
VTFSASAAAASAFSDFFLLSYAATFFFAASRRFLSSAFFSAASFQGLTLVHCSAQLEPCRTQRNTQHTLNTPYKPPNTGYTTPTRTPYPIKGAQVELRSERV